MTRSIRAIYENGVFHPLEPISCRDKEQVLLTVETVATGEEGVLDLEFDAFCDTQADDTVTLESVRQALARIPGSLAEDIRTDRNKR